VTGDWTNETVVQSWNSMPRAAVEALEPDGGLPKRHLINPVVLRMLGEVRGQRVLDAGCGHGYLSRILADLGATVVGVEPAEGRAARWTRRDLPQPSRVPAPVPDLA
jgi:2-polyprenyl-3-methyl-5-hydroxy-6-metoxy-1,4-benzoquinol methylase